MKYQTYCKNQREVATIINEILDNYWQKNIEEERMEEAIIGIYKNNMEKIYKDGKYTKIVQQQCGKKRLLVVSKIIEKETGSDLI